MDKFECDTHKLIFASPTNFLFHWLLDKLSTIFQKKSKKNIFYIVILKPIICYRKKMVCLIKFVKLF